MFSCMDCAFYIYFVLFINAVHFSRVAGYLAHSTTNTECMTQVHGFTYVGNISKLSDGTNCQTWSSNTPYDHRYREDWYFPDGSVNSAADHCRQVGGNAKRPWCYSATYAGSWNYCDVPYCNSCHDELGMGSGQIEDDQLSASSYNITTMPSAGRLGLGLGGGQGWCTESGVISNVWYQIQLKMPHRVYGVKVQGSTMSLTDSITSLSVEYGSNGTLGNFILNHTNNEVAVFEGPAKRASRDTPASRRQVAEASWSIIITDIIRLHLHADEDIDTICGSFELIGCKECRHTAQGHTYEGLISETKSGKTCLRWDSGRPWQHPYTEDNMFPDRSVSDAGNYCRNPGNCASGPWCYVDSWEANWEYCDIPHCECKTDRKGEEYQGKVNKTANGTDCQRWDSQSPHSHSYTVASFPDTSLQDVNNYCRNPNGSQPDGPWCFIVEGGATWEYCDVPFCDCQATEYTGKRRYTSSGAICKPWSHTTLDDSVFPDGSKEAAENFCRKVDKYMPWCYLPISNGAGHWEYCDVRLCGTSASASSKCPAVIYDYVTHTTTNKDCKTQIIGKTYVGNHSVTSENITCHTWIGFSTSYYHRDYLFPDANEASARNYCRNPSASQHPWCYTTDPDVRWQYCDIPLCHSCHDELGMGSGQIKDDQLSASSYNITMPSAGRLGLGLGDGLGWCAESGVISNVWYQIQLKMPHRVYGVMVQGSTIMMTDSFSHFTVEYGPNGILQYFVMNDTSPSVAIFEGPARKANRVDQRQEVSEATWPLIIAGIIRFHLTTDSTVTNICGFFELLGCLECRNTQAGYSYAGAVSKTVSGKNCQRWDSQSPWHHPYISDNMFPDRHLSDAGNYCRNPGNCASGPWCYVDSWEANWEYCDIPHCECKIDKKGVDYQGNVNKTVSGKDCQRWDSQSPHTHSYTGASFPDISLPNTNNYCRNPDGSQPDGPWCFTAHAGTTWEYCEVPYCECMSTSGVYTGKRRHTVDGRVCKYWNETTQSDSSFPDGSKLAAQNFCRVLGENLPWCYTTDGSWAFCDIGPCESSHTPDRSCPESVTGVPPTIETTADGKETTLADEEAQTTTTKIERISGENDKTTTSDSQVETTTTKLEKSSGENAETTNLSESKVSTTRTESTVGVNTSSDVSMEAFCKSSQHFNVETATFVTNSMEDSPLLPQCALMCQSNTQCVGFRHVTEVCHMQILTSQALAVLKASMYEPCFIPCKQLEECN